MTTFSTSAALIIGAAACVTDLHSRRIPNWLTFGAAAVAIAMQYASSGSVGVQHAMSGWITGLFLFMPLFLLGGMGAGDVKLMAAIGMWIGPAAVLHALLYASIAGGLLALTVALLRGVLRQTVQNVQLLILHWQVAGFAPHAQLTLATATSPRLAYAVPVLMGTVVAAWLR